MASRNQAALRSVSGVRVSLTVMIATFTMPMLCAFWRCSCVLAEPESIPTAYAIYSLPIMINLPSLFALDGKTALVTGGSRGLGEEIAIGLAEAGAPVYLVALREKWPRPARQAAARDALRRLRRQQRRADRLDARTGGQMGAAQYSGQRDRAGVLCDTDDRGSTAPYGRGPARKCADGAARARGRDQGRGR